MPSETLCKTVHQYSKEPVSDEDMEKLLAIAGDYTRVKNYVYARFGGIGSLEKIYPGYTVQNEMTESGLRGELGLPSVYFYLAVFDALGDIRGQWARTKSKVLKLIAVNESFTAEEKHYLRFLIKVSNAFAATLNQEQLKLPEEIQNQHDSLAEAVDADRMRRYLCRQVRKYHIKPHTDAAEGFSISERAYRYEDHGIYIAVKQKRKRIFIPLTDSNRYKSQLYIRLYPKESRLEIRVPIQVAVQKHMDYQNCVGVSFGMYTMLTTNEGHSYGTEFGTYQREYADWIRQQTGSYSRNRKDNPGRKKYQAKKQRYEEQLHSYINHELNRFLKTEKPKVIYVVKLPKPQGGGINRKINHSVAMWQRGYIRSRLWQKCKEQSVEIVEVLGKGIGRECSRCGAAGSKKEGIFSCPSCGYSVEEKTNTAKNALKRGMEGKTINK